MPLPTCAPGNDVERLLFLKILATTSDPVTFNQSVSCSCEVRAHCGFGKCFLVLSKKKKPTLSQVPIGTWEIYSWWKVSILFN